MSQHKIQIITSWLGYAQTTTVTQRLSLWPVCKENHTYLSYLLSCYKRDRLNILLCIQYLKYYTVIYVCIKVNNKTSKHEKEKKEMYTWIISIQ